MKRWRLLTRGMCAASLISLWAVEAQQANHPVPAEGLKLTLWAREPMVMDPVALSFDDNGVLYVAETARRGTVDIDIRSHRDWLVEDLANQSVDDLRRSFRRWMAPERDQENAPWLTDRNEDGVHDWHDLQQVKERIRRLEDTLGRGKADRSQIFATGFNEEISGVVAGVMPWNGAVWVTGYPELKRFHDQNQDGLADAEETVFRGFGVHAAFDGHDLHGLIMGPDGKIYFSCGDNGFSVTNREGQLLHHPNTGGVLRMDPDGSHLEVFATGLRNPQEIAFDDDGNLFAVDNDGDLREERERFVHIAEGSDSGWRLNWQFRDPGWSDVTHQPDYNPWMDEHMWVPQHPNQPAYITPPITNYSVGPGSFVHNPGTALGEAYRNHFFLIQFPVQKVTTFQARAKGAGFEMVHERSVLTGMMASSLAFSPNGALFVGDWDGMWNPDGKGAIWFLDDPQMTGSAKRQEVQELLRHGMSTRDTTELKRLMGHADQRIRMRSQFELVRRKSREELLSIALQRNAPSLARMHALWGLGQLRTALSAKQLPLSDPDSRVRAQAAKISGDLQLTQAVVPLIRLLQDSNARVRFHAALALGKISDPKALHGLVTLLAENRDQDPFLRHAAVMGLVGLHKPELLGALCKAPSPSVRIGAVIALRRLRSPLLTLFLEDPDLRVRREAARGIHDDESVPEALPMLAMLLVKPSSPTDEAIVRRSISANLRLGTSETAQRLLDYVQQTDAPEDLRIEAIAALGAWNQIPSLDRVEGRVRALSSRDPGLGGHTVAGALEQLWPKASPKLALVLVRLVLEQNLAAPTMLLTDCVQSSRHPPNLRAQALRALAKSKTPQLKELLHQAQQDQEAELHRAALEILAQQFPKDFITFLGEHYVHQPLREQQLALRLAGKLSDSGSTEFLSGQLARLESGDLPRELALDLLDAIRNHSSAELKTRSASWEQAKPGRKSQLLLAGGDVEAGRRVFQGSVQGQCGRCHNAGGEGQQAGPVLNGIGKRATPEYLLEALLDPSARIADGYATINLTLKNGEDLDGLLLGQTEQELRLRLPTGEVRNIAVQGIQRRSANPQSVMPPMGDVLTPRELRDLIAFLAGWK